MIYLVMYSIVVQGTTLSGLFYAWGRNLSEAEKLYKDLVLTKECFRKEIWTDNGKGYRQLVMQEVYDSQKEAVHASEQ